MIAKARTAKNANILDWYDTLVFALALPIVLFVMFGRVATVNGRSMQPTLLDGDRVFLRTVAYEPQRGDVVIADDYIPYGRRLVKRVIAVGGDTVDIDFGEGVVYVNDQPLDEPYTADATYLAEGTEFPLVVPKGYVFLMGDNRNNSTDSRDASVGCIDVRDILGKVIFRLFPLKTIGSIS